MLSGAEYEIDVNAEHANDLRQVLGRYTEPPGRHQEAGVAKGRSSLPPAAWTRRPSANRPLITACR